MTEVAKMNSLLTCSTAADWSATLFAIGADLGFEQVLFGAVSSKHMKLESAFLQSNYSPAWRQRYDADKLHYVDPTVSHCLGSCLPMVWEPDLFKSVGEQEFYEEARHHGVCSGITFPIHGPNGEFGIVSFASTVRPDIRFRNDVAHVLPQLSMLRDYAFESSMRFIHCQSEATPHLTKRELEVLNWVMVGKSSWEISMITNCSEATVNFHIANIRQKFNVNTRQQALVKAISLGILNPEDPHR
jgi:LuxR family quorum-sensing transcriptional regulator LasR